MPNHELIKTMLLGMLVGGGTYGGLRLAKDISANSQSYQQPANQLQLTLPSSRLPQNKTASTKVANSPVFDQYIGPLLAGGGGAVGGFLGASKLYEMYKQKQLKDQMGSVENQYLQTLQKAHQKTASLGDTPLVDKMIDGMISKFGEVYKEAWGGIMPDPSAGNPLMDAGSGIYQAIKNSQGGTAVKAALAIALMGSTAATYGIGKRMDAQKDASKAQSTIPTDIRLNVAN